MEETDEFDRKFLKEKGFIEGDRSVLGIHD